MTVPLPGPPAHPGDPQQRVQLALAALDELPRRPLAEHVEVFDTLHAALTDALAAPSGPE
ncbi:MAG TPA: hypothetical protein VNO83_08615 [Pseudonocardia sp.]|jgi:hypothetical protein|nr:hypothetical protein [Pseudonocardia sp.]